MHLAKDIEQYAFYFLFTHFSDKENLKQLIDIDVNTLINFREQLTDEGNLVGDAIVSYYEFIEWTNFEKRDSNTNLTNSLNKAIYHKKIEYAKTVREDRNNFERKLQEHRDKLLDEFSNNDCYKKENKDNLFGDSINRITDISMFDAKVTSFGSESLISSWIHRMMFESNKQNFLSSSVNYDDFNSTIQCIKEIQLILLDNKIQLDECWTDTLSEVFEYDTLNEDDKSYLSEFDKNKVKAGCWKDSGVMSIYIASNVFTPIFSVPDNFISLQEYLDLSKLEDLAESSKSGSKYGFIVRNDLFIPCSKDEAIEYFKYTKCCIHYDYVFSKSTNTCGYYLAYPEIN